VRVGGTRPSGGSLRDIGYGMEPTWSPSAHRIAFVTFPDHDTTDPPGYIGVMNPDGSARQFLAPGGRPAWSPDGTKIVFSGLQVMNADGSDRTTVGQPQIGGLDPDWQPLPYPGYPRPKSANSVRVSLVPAFTPCSSPNRVHGPPLAYGSCNPPAAESGELTVGTGAEGFVRYRALSGNPATLADEADIALRVQISDVREQATLADYAGAVRGESTVRLVDRASGGPATVVDVLFPLLTQCTPTEDASAGSDCSLSTTLDALIPDAIAEGQRTVLELGQVRVADGGPDADPLTEPNTVLLRQGLFVP
jgi:WD40-like Beta Propeller Repeat